MDLFEGNWKAWLLGSSFPGYKLKSEIGPVQGRIQVEASVDGLTLFTVCYKIIYKIVFIKILTKIILHMYIIFSIYSTYPLMFNF